MPEPRTLTFREATVEALVQAMEANPRVVCFGDLRSSTEPPNALSRFSGRLFEPPISETAYIGAAAGLALSGWRPFCDTSTSSFMFTGFDQVVNEAPVFRYLSAGQVCVPLVLRIASGVRGGGGAQHSHSPERWLMSVPGLKVVQPSTPYDAKGLMLAAMQDDNPVVFVDHVRLAGLRGPVPAEPYTVPLGAAEVRRAGADVTLVAAGMMVTRALEAATLLEADGVDAEVLDLRSLKPLDTAAVLASVRKTGRLVVVDESPPGPGLTAEIGALVAETDPRLLRAPLRRLGLPDAPVPYSPPLEESFVPSAARIAATARALLAPR